MACLTFTVMVGVIACGMDEPAETLIDQPAPTANPTPTAAFTATPTSTPAPSPTPTSTPTPTETISPTRTEVVTSGHSNISFRELFIWSNLDGGALLLPYIDASASQKAFSLISTSTLIGSHSCDDYRQSTATLFRVSDEIHYTELIEFEDPELIALFGVEVFNTVGFQTISNGVWFYARLSEEDKWVDMSSLQQDSENADASTREESFLGTTLFAEASNPFFENYSELTESQKALLADSEPYSPFLSFREVSSEEGSLVIAHNRDVVVGEGDNAVRQFHKVEFTINAEDELINRVINYLSAESVRPHPCGNSSSSRELEIDYAQQPLVIPAEGEIETDPETIAAFLELFE